MKCEDCQVLIEEYLDGALDQQAGARVSSHVAGCSSCGSLFEQASREQEIYARYQRDVEVTPLLWSSIEARIKQERAAEPGGIVSRLRERLAGAFVVPRLSPAFAAALVLIAMGLTAAVMTYLNSRGPDVEIATGNGNTQTEPRGGEKQPAPPQVAPPETSNPEASNKDEIAKAEAPSRNVPSKTGSVVPPRPVRVTAQVTPAQLVREAEQKYLAAIAMLSRDVSRHRSQLDPILLARFDASLSEIDRTIKETRRVVRDNPGDPIALQYLLGAYSKKVDVLREMTNN